MISCQNKKVPRAADVRLRQDEAQPLNELLQKDKAFVWTLECQAASEEIKLELLNDAVLPQVCRGL